MALTVETGEGLAAAESYNSLAEIAAYAAARGLTFAISPEEPAEQAARRATTWLDAIYRPMWPGRKRMLRAQALEWPRVDATDINCDAIDYASVPAEVKAAHCEAAIREKASPGSLSPDFVAANQVTSEKVGPIAVTYSDRAMTAEDSRPIATVIDDILSGLIGRRGPVLFGAAGRA